MSLRFGISICDLCTLAKDFVTKIKLLEKLIEVNSKSKIQISENKTL